MMILMAQLMPLTLMAQDDDLYFVPKENKEIKKQRPARVVPQQQTYYCGSNRDVDEYNRRPSYMLDSLNSKRHLLGADSIVGDSNVMKGRRIEPGTDYDDGGDYSYTKRMKRFEGYDCGGMDYSDYCDLYNSGYRNGYMDGLTSWNISIGWYDPWWFSSRFYGWNGWYNAYYFGGWYNPWYYGWGWYDPWWPGYYYPVHHYRYYSGYRGTRNHSYGAYGNGSRRHSVYNGHYRGSSHRGSNGYNNGRYNNSRNRGFGNNGSWNNRSNRRNNSGSWENHNRRGSDLNRGSSFGGSRSNRGGNFGGGSRGGGSRGGRFGGGR